MALPLLAVHISDGPLSWPWLLAGFGLAGLLLTWGSRRIADEEIPRIGLLTAALFVASLIHVRLGPTSVHLLLNGLVGIVLGGRAALAIAVGLFLQALLLGHGGYTTLGVNCCVLLLPALVAPALFRYLRDGRSEAVWWRSAAMAAGYILHVIVMAVVGLIALFVESIGRRAPFDPAFRAGFGTGVTVVLLTSLLNCLVLVAGGVEDWRVVAAVSFAAHLPLAVIEGLVVGSVASFLGRVKPEMLRG